MLRNKKCSPDIGRQKSLKENNILLYTLSAIFVAQHKREHFCCAIIVAQHELEQSFIRTEGIIYSPEYQMMLFIFRLFYPTKSRYGLCASLTVLTTSIKLGCLCSVFCFDKMILTKGYEYQIIVVRMPQRCFRFQQHHTPQNLTLFVIHCQD